jgi:AsmA-like protein
LRLLRSRRRALLTAIVVVLALFLARPGVQSLRARIVRSISLALGRQVEVSQVRLRLLPQPGFDLENFVVHDDPSFSAEPLLRAADVAASLRLIPLVRGRLEIARLSMSEPSLNLARNDAGHWNVEELVERAAKIPVAPTGKARTERRPGFPYIEADRGRINFKFGQEKKPYALTDADFALWQDSENVWSVRVKAQPVRTDFNLTDMGIFRLSGSWYRAPSLRQTPLQFTLQWNEAQLGQASKLAFGNDKGWRGRLAVAVVLAGKPAALNVNTNFSVQDFRRYDIPGGDSLRLAAHCAGRYSSVDHAISNLDCRAPIGDGLLSLRGNVDGIVGNRGYDLALAAQDVPMRALLAFARHAKKDLPDDLVAGGTLDGNVSMRHEPRSDHPTWQGAGETAGCTLTSEMTKSELAPDRIPFAISSGDDLPAGRRLRRSESRPKIFHQPRLEIGPFDLALGRPTLATVRGWISRSGYSVALAGDTRVHTLLQLARMLGLPASQPRADGLAKVDLQVAGMWAGFASPTVTGKAQLHSVYAGLRGVSEPLEIATANVVFAPDQINVQGLTASFAGSSWRGSLNLPRPCASPDACPAQFDIHADVISTSRLAPVINPQTKKPWYRFLSSSPPGESFFAALRATGKLTANMVHIQQLVANQVSTNVELDRGVIHLSGLGAEILGGSHIGKWDADFTVKPPVYRGTGTLQRVSLGQLASLMNDGWITGTANGTYQIKTSGLKTVELLSTATGTVEFDARDGQLPHLALAANTGPLHINHFQGRFILRDGSLEIEQGKLETPGSIYRISGTASLNRTLDINLMRNGARGFKIAGTLAEPHVEAAVAPETQAALKP